MVRVTVRKLSPPPPPHHHHHHILVYSVVLKCNSSHRGKITQRLKTVLQQYKYNDQLLELIVVFVQHSYEKVSVVKFGCAVELFFSVCSLS